MVCLISDELCHHGIKGQKWGVRRTPEQLGHRIPRSTVRAAKKDAKEYARAKMYYGEGAGTRRKLIKATVNQRSKSDPYYKEEFERQLAKQDMAKHAAKAREERGFNDAKNTISKTGRGLINAATGNIGRASATAAGLYMLAHYTGIDKKVADYGRQFVSNIPNIATNVGQKWADYRFRRNVF